MAYMQLPIHLPQGLR